MHVYIWAYVSYWDLPLWSHQLLGPRGELRIDREWRLKTSNIHHVPAWMSYNLSSHERCVSLHSVNRNLWLVCHYYKLACWFGKCVYMSMLHMVVNVLEITPKWKSWNVLFCKICTKDFEPEWYKEATMQTISSLRDCLLNLRKSDAVVHVARGQPSQWCVLEVVNF